MVQRGQSTIPEFSVTQHEEQQALPIRPILAKLTHPLVSKEIQIACVMESRLLDSEFIPGNGFDRLMSHDYRLLRLKAE